MAEHPLMVWLAATLDDVAREIRVLIAALELKADDYAPEDDGLNPADLPGGWDWWGDFGLRVDQFIRPSDWLAGVEADRAILAEHRRCGPVDYSFSGSRRLPWCGRCSDAEDGPMYWPCRTVLLVASRYRHRPGWREEWSTT